MATNKETRQAIEASILHWENNLSGLEEIPEIYRGVFDPIDDNILEHTNRWSTSGFDCALCKTFSNPTYINECMDCPLDIHCIACDDEDGEEQSPYGYVRIADSYDEIHAATLNMIEVLRSLLPHYPESADA